MDANTIAHFETLTRDREENARVLAKRSKRGFWNSVVEKYSEQAHFVYELLQNADDAGATTVRFILSNSQLLFAYNGTRHFSITDPTREEEDTDAGRLGDINAITSIANSTKGDEATIGKFGVGFKAVFQYTTTPYIYGPGVGFKAVFQYTTTPYIYGPGVGFKIDDFIVPKLLVDDHPDRREGETLFVFPFDRQGMPGERALQEISERLSALDYSTLFLRNLSEVRYKTPTKDGRFSKRVMSSYERNGVTATLLRMSKKENGGESIDDLWLMSSSSEDGLTCSVGFFVGADGLLRPVKRNAFCFFPTKVPTGLNFVVNAPFLLTDSREGIKEGAQHNIEMIGRLATLSVASLPFLRDLGEETGRRIIGDNLFDVVPYDWDQHDWMYNRSSENSFTFTRICEAMRDVFRKERMLPGANDYFKAEDSYIAETKQLSQLIDEDQLRSLTGKSVVGKILASTFSRSLPTSLQIFLRKLGTTVVDEVFLIQRLNGHFTASQNLKWLSRLHSYLSETTYRVNQARSLPIFVDTEGRSVAAFDRKGNELLFLPAEGADDVTIIEPASLELEGTRALVKALELKAPSLKARVMNKILPSYASGRDPRDTAAFKAVFQCYIDVGESLTFLGEVSEYPLLACVTSSGPVAQGVKPCDAYVPTEQLREYFSIKEDVCFVDMDFYRNAVGDHKSLKHFIEGLRVSKHPKLITREIKPSEEPELRDRSWSRCAKERHESWHETELDGCAENLNSIMMTSDTNRSLILWRILVDFVRYDCTNSMPRDFLHGEHEFFFRKAGSEIYESTLVLRLKSRQWLVDREGNFVAPDNLERTSLSERYDVTSDEAKTLAEFLGMVEPEIKELNNEERLASSLYSMAHRIGIEDPDTLMQSPVFLTGIEGLMRSCCPETRESVSEVSKVASISGRFDSSPHSRHAKYEGIGSDSLLDSIEAILGMGGQGTVAKNEVSVDSDDDGPEESVDSTTARKAKVRQHFRSLLGEDGLEDVADDIERRVYKWRRERSGTAKSEDSSKRKKAAQQTQAHAPNQGGRGRKHRRRRPYAFHH